MRQDDCYLAGGEYERLGQLLWQQWKFLCDPSHIGIWILAFRGYLLILAFSKKHHRCPKPLYLSMLGLVTVCLALQVSIRNPSRRGLNQEAIKERVIQDALLPSLVVLMTLVTIILRRLPANPDLWAKVDEGWRGLDSGTIVGGIIWDEWARNALGVLKI